MTTTLRCFLVTVFAMAAAPAFAVPEKIGAVERVQEEVVAKQPTVARDLHNSDSLLFRDEVRTGAGARFQGRLADGTELTLGEKGSLTIDNFVYSPGVTGGKLAVSVAKGAFLFVGGKVEEPSGGHVAIKLPIGTLGVRGTTVWGGKIDGGFGVWVIKGEVTLKTRRGLIDIKAGESAMIYRDRRVAERAPWSEDRMKRALASVEIR